MLRRNTTAAAVFSLTRVPKGTGRKIPPLHQSAGPVVALETLQHAVQLHRMRASTGPTWRALESRCTRLLRDIVNGYECKRLASWLDQMSRLARFAMHVAKRPVAPISGRNPCLVDGNRLTRGKRRVDQRLLKPRDVPELPFSRWGW